MNKSGEDFDIDKSLRANFKILSQRLNIIIIINIIRATNVKIWFQLGECILRKWPLIFKLLISLKKQ